jgi:hypothetical protein
MGSPVPEDSQSSIVNRRVENRLPASDAETTIDYRLSPAGRIAINSGPSVSESTS